MNIVCAYCHIKGHHIKFCGELAEKNRRQSANKLHSSTNLKLRNPSASFITEATKTYKPSASTNLFVDLYSSDEEEDNVAGELVMQNTTTMQEDSDLYKWTRSGVKNKFISSSDDENTKNKSDEDECEMDVSKLLAGLDAIGYYGIKYKGMSWADIENLSEDEEE